MSAATVENLKPATEFDIPQLASSWRPSVGVVLGSGLGAFADALEGAQDLPYAEPLIAREITWDDGVIWGIDRGREGVVAIDPGTAQFVTVSR